MLHESTWQPDAARDEQSISSTSLFLKLDHPTDLDHLEDYIVGVYDQLCTMDLWSSKAKNGCRTHPLPQMLLHPQNFRVITGCQSGAN